MISFGFIRKSFTYSYVKNRPHIVGQSYHQDHDLNKLESPLHGEASTQLTVVLVNRFAKSSKNSTPL